MVKNMGMQDMRKGLITWLFVCLFLSAARCYSEEGREKPSGTYICRQTAGRIVIDGSLDEADWRKAESVNFYRLDKEDLQNHFPAESPAIGKLLWDKDYLYVGLKAFDKDIWGYYTKRDEQTCREDVLEIFLKPNAQRESYYNFEINALGTVFDAFDVKRRFAGGSYRWSKWNCEGLMTGINIKGTLNDWKDKDEYWQLEVAIPFSAFKETASPPEPGDEWSFAFCRYDYSIYLKKGLELSSTAKLSKFNFHFWEDYDKLLFQK